MKINAMRLKFFGPGFGILTHKFRLNLFHHWMLRFVLSLNFRQKGGLRLAERETLPAIPWDDRNSFYAQEGFLPYSRVPTSST